MKAKQQPARDVGEQFRLLVESIEDYAIFLLDPQGNVSSWNPGAERIKGYRAEEIIGRHFSVFYPSEDVDRRKPQSELQVAARDGRFEEEGWRLRKGGTRFWADVVLTAIRDERGRVIGFGKVTRDLTERKWGEEEKFGKMFRLCPVPLAIVTLAEGRFVEANEAYVRLVGYPREELIGRTVAEVNIHPQAEQRTALMKAIESGQKVRNVEGVLRSKSGEERSVLHSAELIEVGENPCMVTAVQDVTEIKRLEDAVREASTPVLRVREGLLIGAVQSCCRKPGEHRCEPGSVRGARRPPKRHRRGGAVVESTVEAEPPDSDRTRRRRFRPSKLSSRNQSVSSPREEPQKTTRNLRTSGAIGTASQFMRPLIDSRF